MRDKLRAELTGALKARDRVAVSALRSAIAAIENAEAVDAADGPQAKAIESSPVGLAAADVARRALTEEQVEQIVRAEITEREQAAREYDGKAPDRAQELRAQAQILAAFVTHSSTDTRGSAEG